MIRSHTSRRRWMLAFLLVGVIPFVSCGTDTETKPADSPPVKIPETTKVLQASDMEHLLSVSSAQDSLLFDVGATGVSDLGAGDVIVSDHGDGILRKVVSLEAASGQILVLTEAAALTDAVEDGNMDVTQAITASQIKSVTTRFGDKSAQVTEGPQGEIVIQLRDIIVYDHDRNQQTTRDQVRVNGRITLAPTFRLAHSIRGFSVDSVRAEVRGQCQAELEIHYDLPGLQLEEEMELLRLRVAPITVPIGPVPVVLVPEITIRAKLKLELGVSVSTSVTGVADFDVAGRYRDGDFTGGGSVEFSMSATPPDLDVEFRGKLKIGPDFSIKLYGIVGPVIQIWPFAELRAVPTDNPWLSLYGGVEGDVGLRLDIFNAVRRDYKREAVIQVRWLLVQSPKACFTAQPSPGTTDAPIEFDASCSSDAQDSASALQVRWDWDGDMSWDGPYSSSPIAIHQFTTVGAHRVWMQIKDPGGLFGVTSQTVQVSVGAPACRVTPSQLDFGSVPVGQTKDLTFTIRNAGAGTLTGNVSEGCSFFVIQSGGGAYSLTASQEKTVMVRFAPASAGAQACTIALGGTACASLNCTGTGGGSTPPATMVLVPAGTFSMGSPTGERGHRADETLHTVSLSRSFYMSAVEVQQAEWSSIMGWNESSFTGNPNRPVEQVTWFDAVEFCNRKSAQDGLSAAYGITAKTISGNHITAASVAWNVGGSGYRLPTEAEWEYACRAGSQTAFSNGGITYPDGCSPADPVLSLIGWYCGSGTHTVGGKTANALGLFDMHGNVREWCWDWNGAYPAGSATDPRGPDPGPGATTRVWRGGSWKDNAENCRSAARYGFVPGVRDNAVGLRLVRPVF